MRGFALAAVLAFLPPSASAAVEVQVESDGRVSVRADAPASEVLDRLAARTGMKIVYEGTAPRAHVMVAFERRTPAEAVLMILEGLGVDHVMRLDATGKRPEMLMLSASNAPSRAPAPPAPASTVMRPPPPPPEEVVEEEPEPESEEPPPDEADPTLTRRPPVPGQPMPGQQVPGQTMPVQSQPGQPARTPVGPQTAPQAPGNRPTFIPPNYPVSPFAPLAPSPPTVVAPPTPSPAPEPNGDPDQ